MDRSPLEKIWKEQDRVPRKEEDWKRFWRETEKGTWRGV
jgi:hypothetical protein